MRQMKEPCARGDVVAIDVADTDDPAHFIQSCTNVLATVPA
jgi:hypothetical protein